MQSKPFKCSGVQCFNLLVILTQMVIGVGGLKQYTATVT